jgi:hypothetical protein
LSDPPLPEGFDFSWPPGEQLGQIVCDGFHYGGAPPAWHHALDPAMLAKEVPYFDATDITDVPKDKADLLKFARQTLLGGGSFLIRPALRDAAIRAKVEEKFGNLNFKQLELHEKLLKDAWLRALEHQRCDPLRSFVPNSTEH